MTAFTDQELANLHALAAIAPQLQEIVRCQLAIASVYSKIINSSEPTASSPVQPSAESSVTPPATPYPDRPVWRGNNTVQIGDIVIRLPDQMARICEVFAKIGPVLSSPDIDAELECDKAARYLKRIQDRYPALARFIVLPGGKGFGGYRFDIIDGEE